MRTASLAGPAPHVATDGPGPIRVALLGNPNTGKTTLFNRLCGLRHKVSNFPGTTQEARIGRIQGDPPIELIDLPGAYSLELSAPEAVICRQTVEGARPVPGAAPRRLDAIMIVLDAANLERNLVFAAEAMERALPTALVLTMTDEAARRGASVDVDALSARLGRPIMTLGSRREAQPDRVRQHIKDAIASGPAAPVTDRSFEARRNWAAAVARDVTPPPGPEASRRRSQRLDALLTNPIGGLAVFLAVMGALFYAVFKLAQYPMGLIDSLFAAVATWVEATLPAGALSDLLTNGIIAGVGATLVFLPQICLLFFLISLLEETGYLARAAMMTDRWLRPFGLTGQSFVPLLSAHACALPAISACRGIGDPRSRLATILTAPFMSCTARIPVYILLTVLLFPGRPLLQTLAFSACYLIGILAGVFSAAIARRTILRGASRPMVIELPSYRRPSLRSALIVAMDRGLVFLRKAGTVILAVSIVLWWLGSYPRSGPSPAGEALRAQARVVDSSLAAAELNERAEEFDARYAASRTFLARIGSAIQPIFEPLGYDRQLTVGVLASFAAREVFVTTMAVQIAGREDIEGEGLVETMRSARRDDGRPVFTTAASWSLLVYYILAMQCLPTLIVTAREAGSWKWAALQGGWMLLLAWIAGTATYQAISALAPPAPVPVVESSP
ncbi:MAG: ferrous iron transporter B [Phycisphaerales bacterium JB039]